MQERVIQAEVDMVEAINALRVEDFATQEEYQAEVTRITEYYTGMRNYALDELNKAIENSKTIYQNDWLAYSEKTGCKIFKEADWRQAFKDTEIAMVTGYDTIEKSRSAFELNMTTMVDTLIDAFGKWEIDVRDTFDIVEQEFDNFGGENGTLNKKVKNITSKLNEVDEKFKGWKDIATTGFKGITEAATEQFNNFSSKITQYKDEINRITAALTAMLELAGVELPPPKVETETEGVEGDRSGGKVVPPVIDPDGNSNQRYYGTYYDLEGKQRVTATDYGSIKDAKDGAQKEAQEEFA